MPFFTRRAAKGGKKTTDQDLLCTTIPLGFRPFDPVSSESAGELFLIKTPLAGLGTHLGLVLVVKSVKKR